MRKLFILLALPLLLGAGHDLSSRAKAKASVGALVKDDDYPAWAIEAGMQGSVAFILDIGSDGHVTGCTIESSSGWALLDDTTCRIMTARAQFIPAHDRRGRPTADRVRASIRWILPEPSTAKDGNEAQPPSS